MLSKSVAADARPEMHKVRVRWVVFDKDGTRKEGDAVVLDLSTWYGRESPGIGVQLPIHVSKHAVAVCSTNHCRPPIVTLVMGSRMCGHVVEVVVNGDIQKTFVVSKDVEVRFPVKIPKQDVKGMSGIRVTSISKDGNEVALPLEEHFELVLLGLVDPSEDPSKPPVERTKSRKGTPKKLVLPKKDDAPPYVPVVIDLSKGWQPAKLTCDVRDFVKAMKHTYALRVRRWRKTVPSAPKGEPLDQPLKARLFNLRQKVRVGRFGRKPMLEAKVGRKPVETEDWTEAKKKHDLDTNADLSKPERVQKSVEDIEKSTSKLAVSFPGEVISGFSCDAVFSVAAFLRSLPPPEPNLRRGMLDTMKEANKVSLDILGDLLRTKIVIDGVQSVLGFEKRPREQQLYEEGQRAKETRKELLEALKYNITEFLGRYVIPNDTICFVRTTTGAIDPGNVFSAKPGMVVGYDRNTRATLIRIGHGPSSEVKGFHLPNPCVHFTFQGAVGLPEEKRHVSFKATVRRLATEGVFVMPGTPVFVRRPFYQRGTIVRFNHEESVIFVDFGDGQDPVQYKVPHDQVFFTSWAAKGERFFIRVPDEEPLPGNRFACLEATVIGRSFTTQGAVLMSYHPNQVPLEMMPSDPDIFPTRAEAEDPLPTKRPRDDGDDGPDPKKPRSDDESDPGSPIITAGRN